MVRKDWIRGGSRGGNMQQSVQIVVTMDRTIPKIDASNVACVPQPGSAIESEDRGEEKRGEERMRDCDEGMWTNGYPFIRLSGSPVIHRADSLVGVGGLRTVSCMVESMF